MLDSLTDPSRPWPALAGVLTLALLCHAVPAGAGETTEDPRLSASRQAVAAFAAELKGALTAGLAGGGPAGAIGVCQVQAPAIAADRSRALGAQVGRTSARIRNPVSAPTKAQRAVLEAFARRISAGEGPAAIEHWGTRADGRALYMKPIIVGEPCLACHGKVLDPAVAATLDAGYPEDRARGYDTGDLRGAFRIVWPAE
jgi:hypothetical protein